MTDSLRDRIAAVIRREVPCHPPAADRIADALIAELGLEALERIARSWYQNYDTIPANDPRYPTDMDIAYDDAGEQILRALGLLQ